MKKTRTRWTSIFKSPAHVQNIPVPLPHVQNMPASLPHIQNIPASLPHVQNIPASSPHVQNMPAPNVTCSTHNHTHEINQTLRSDKNVLHITKFKPHENNFMSLSNLIDTYEPSELLSTGTIIISITQIANIIQASFCTTCKSHVNEISLSQSVYGQSGKFSFACNNCSKTWEAHASPKNESNSSYDIPLRAAISWIMSGLSYESYKHFFDIMNI